MSSAKWRPSCLDLNVLIYGACKKDAAITKAPSLIGLGTWDISNFWSTII